MKLVRYGKPGKEKPGLIDAEGKLRDLSAVVPDIGPAQLGDAAIAKLLAEGARMVDEKPRNGAHRTRIAFIHPKSSLGVLTELCQAGH